MEVVIAPLECEDLSSLSFASAPSSNGSRPAANAPGANEGGRAGSSPELDSQRPKRYNLSGGPRAAPSKSHVYGQGESNVLGRRTIGSN
jgi:hypothetical protein